MNCRRNVIAGIGNSLVQLLLPFVVRTVVLYELGEDYLGLSSLFTSVFNVLNLAELGVSSAIVYSIYKPLALGDSGKVCNALAFYRRVYFIIGSIIFIAGFCVMPFLRLLVAGDLPDGINIYWLFFLYLIDVSVNYFMFAHKISLLNALQRVDQVYRVRMVTHILQYGMQIMVIWFTHNYYLYFGCAILGSIARNLWNEYICSRDYPEYQCRGMLGKEEKKEISRQVAALFMQKIADMSRNAFDSMILSMYHGLSVVGVFGNYYFIVNGLKRFFGIIMNAVQASVGNAVATESREKNYGDLRKLSFVFGWFTTWFTVCLVCLMQPFVTLWCGKDLLLNNKEMLLFCIYFYSMCAFAGFEVYFSGSGLWWRAKGSYVLETAGNIVLNFLLGYRFGVSGILAASIVTHTLGGNLYRVFVLFRHFYGMSAIEYLTDLLTGVLVTAVTCLAAAYLCTLLPLMGWTALLAKAVICVFFPNMMLWLFYNRKQQYREAVLLLKQMIRRKKNG